MGFISKGNGDNLGVLLTQVTNDTIFVGNGIGDFVETGASVTTGGTATATAGDISLDLIIFGTGAGDSVEVGTASATSLGGDATATATGNITSDTMFFNGFGAIFGGVGGTGDHVTVAPTATANATNGTATATATAGEISHDTILFGSGDGAYVEIGPATATASGTNATATATGGGSITNDSFTFGGGDADFVAIIPTATATATGVASATAAASTVGGIISHDTITFGNGDGDYVEVGAATATATATATADNPDGSASSSATATANGAVDFANIDFSQFPPFIPLISSFADAITNDKITFGNGADDFVKIDASANAQANASTSAADSASALGLADGLVVATPEISNDKIIFGNGNGDYVELTGLDATAEADAEALGQVSTAATTTVAEVNTPGEVTNNDITFGHGNNDCVNIAGDLSSNTIRFGNGTDDSVTASNSSNNKITMGNGNGDTVTLGSGDGGDTINTGTGLDTVTVGSHTNPDTFGFALGTNGASFTTITGAQIGDHLTSEKAFGLNLELGINVVNSVTGAMTLADFIAGLVLTSGNTYVGNNGTDTFVVTDHSGQIGAVKLVGVFTGTAAANHVLTLHDVT